MIRVYWYNFTRGIENLILYFNVIWEDRQWDFAYTENILIVKYKRLRKCLASDDHLVATDRDKYVQALDICIKILERRRDSFYTEIWDGEDKPTIVDLHSIEMRDWNWYCDIVKKYGQHWWN